MKDKQKIGIIIGIVFLFLILCAFFIYQKKHSKEISNNTASQVLENTQIQDNIDDIDWDSLKEKDVNLTESYEITTEGSYHLTGEITNGCITIEALGNVKLILDNVKITNNNGPAINVISAKNVMIYLSDNSVNYLTDGNDYKDMDADGAIFSKSDLFFDGNGSLNVTANYLDGIVSNDDLVFLNGNYVISANDDAIRGKDSVTIVDGDYKIKSLGDGIKSTNTEENKGYIVIHNGEFNIDANLDGIQALSKLVIYDGKYSITTGGGSKNNSPSSFNMRGYMEEDTDSKKGLKATSNIVINNGEFIFDTYDDSIHSNQDVGIVNGTFTISSGDYGIHADNLLVIDNGDIKILESYEGLEASKITINNGDISVMALDDGINVAGGADSSSKNRPGENQFASNSDNVLTINGGKIYVNATGDGLDSNGNIYMYGGEVLVDGPTNSGNGALDYNGSFILDVGLLIAVGSNGMLQGVSSSSKQNNVTISFDTTYSANTVLSIVNSKQEEIISYTPSKSFSSVVIASDKLELNEAYTILVNGNTYNTFTMTKTQITMGNMNNSMNKPGRKR